VQLNPWIPYIGRTHPVLDLSEAMIAPDAFNRTEFYNDWMRPQDLLHWVGLRPPVGSDAFLGLGIGLSSRVGAFTAEEQRLLIDLSDHLGRAGEIARRLDLFDAQTRATSAVLSDLAAGVLLVDTGLRVVFANRSAEELLVAGDGLSARGGRLRATAPRLEPALRDAVRRATGEPEADRGPGTTLSLPRPEGAAPLVVSVGPLDERDRPGIGVGRLAILVIGVPERDVGVDHERLRAAYDLTAAEARLGVALCAGRSLAEHAADAGVSLNTVKFHLKAVFEKTGEARQPDLVRCLVGNPVLRRPE
jgi:DNA-binding CsgD family transcriptional regulator